MILSRDVASSRFQVKCRLVLRAVAILQLVRVSAHAKSQKLRAQADPEHWNALFYKLSNALCRFDASLRISWTIAYHNAVRSVFQNLV